MNTISLIESTSNTLIDGVLCEIITLLNENFPKRIHSFYIEGSYADNSRVTTSDIDLLVIFKGQFVDEQENVRAKIVIDNYTPSNPLELDVVVRDEQSLQGGISPNFKLGSILLYGQDVRSQMLLVSLFEWTQDRMHTSCWRTVHLCNRSSVIIYPLPYPSPTAEFYGYDARQLRLVDGREVNCTRDLIRLVGWSATAIIAFKAGRYVARKSDCHKIYQECFHDEWGQFLQDIYELCRGRWNYLIPEDVEERKMLRALCKRTLAFENHFLCIYKEFLLTELQDVDEQVLLYALGRLKEIVLQDSDIEGVLRTLANDQRIVVRDAARSVLQAFK